MIREISIKIENEPGRIYTVARALADAGINIAALSVADGETTGLLRLVVSDVVRARTALMQLQLPAAIGEVLAVAAPDAPGGLAGVLAPLEHASLDVRYLYAFRRPGTEIAVMVLHTEDNTRAAVLMEAAGFTLVDEESLHG